MGMQRDGNSATANGENLQSRLPKLAHPNGDLTSHGQSPPVETTSMTALGDNTGSKCVSYSMYWKKTNESDMYSANMHKKTNE